MPTEESDGAEPARPAAKPRTRRRRLRRWLAVGALAGLLLVGGLYLARNRVLAPFVLARLQPRLERALGGRLTVRTWSGSWWSDLRLEGVAFERTAETGPLVRLVEGDVHARYDLFGLLGGDLQALAAVEVSADELVLAPLSPLPRSRRSDPEAKGQGEAFALPATLPATDLRVERLAVALDANSTARAGGGFQAAADAGALAARGISVGAEEGAVSVDADGLDLGRLVPRAPAGPLAARLRWNAADVALERLSFAGALEAGPSRVDLREVGHGAVTWQLAASLGPWGEGATARPGPAALRTSGTFDPRAREELRLDFTTDGFELARLWPLLPAVPQLEGVVAGEGRWRADLDALARSPAELNLSSEGARVGGFETGSVRVDARLEEGTLSVLTLDVEQPAGSVAVRDLRVPLTSRSPTAFLAAAEGRASLRVGDLPALLAAVDDAAADALRNAPPHVLAIDLDLAGNALSLSAGSAVVDGGELRVARGEVRLPEPGGLEEGERWWEALALDLDVAAEASDLATLARLFGREDFGGSASAAVQLTGTPLALRGSIQAEGEALVVAGTDFGRVELAADAQPKSVEITRVRAEASTLTLDGSGELLYRDVVPGLPLRLRGARLELVVPALEDLPLPTALAGAASAEVRLDGPLERLDGTFGIDLADGVVAGRAIPRLAAQGRIVAGDLLVDSLRGRLEDVELEAGGAVALGPELEVLAVRLDALELVREEAAGEAVALSLAAPATLARETDGVTLDALELVGSAGRVALTARLQGSLTAPELVRGELRLAGPAAADADEDSLLDLGALLGSLLPEAVVDASVGGSLALEWRPTAAPPAHLRGSADLRAVGVLLEADAPTAELVAKAELRENILELSEVTLTAEGLCSASLKGTLPLAPGGEQLLAEGPLALTFGGTTAPLQDWPDALSRVLFGDVLEVRGALRLDGELSGTWRSPTGRASLEGTGLELFDRATERRLIESTPGDAPESFDLNVLVELSQDGATLDGSARLASFGSASVDGALERGLDLAALVGGSTADLFDTPTRARLQLSAPDLTWLGGRLPAVRRAEGAASADVSLEGTLARPALTGSAALDGVSLRLATAFPALQDVDASVRFEGEEVVVDGATGALGGAAFRLGGRVTALRDAAGPRLDLSLEGENLLLYRDVSTRVRANTNLRVSGPLSALRAEGSVELTEGRYGRRFDLLRGLSGEASAPSASQGLDLAIARVGPLARLELGLDVTASEPFEVQSNLIRGGLRPRLGVSGTGEVPLLAGSVFLEPTLVSLPSGKLRIEAGRIEFDPSDPFVPKLELTGGMRLKGYDVQVVVSGAYNDPAIRLASTPPLPNQDLLVLFLTGQLPEGSAGDRGRGAAESVAVYLAQDYISRWMAGPGDPDEESILERIELSIGDDVTRSGALTTEVSYLLTDRAEGPGNEQYLVGERDVYDKINFGYAFRFLFQ